MPIKIYFIVHDIVIKYTIYDNMLRQVTIFRL